MYDIKQYIIINKASGWTKGKMCSQVAHASMGAIFKFLKRGFIQSIHCNGVCLPQTVHYEMDVPIDTDAWIQGAFAKIVLKSENAQEIENLEECAKKFNVPMSLILDSGATQPSKEGITLAIGPFDTTNEQYKELLDHLSKFKLY